ncbi:MAG TPA: cobyric acid synthase [Bryobacteraceae bacterium]|nr:cobyric acid synthase [Bryobacteraceae bacterium]
MSARALMILGTASHVGKSLITAGLGRIFADDGFSVAPFKAQNMSLNSAATPDGCEIGRAQALQAEACRVAACAEMNPVLIKPSSDLSSQIMLMGRVWGQVSASDYHRRRVEELFPAVTASYATLAKRHELILLEGAGSPAEINLKRHDIVNMRMAHAADAQCLLVGDIDRGGVFASLLGTVELLDAKERARIRGFAINKFRGDQDLLRPGVEEMEQRLGIPCAGVIPMLKDLGLEEEDSVSLSDQRRSSAHWKSDASSNRPLRIGVIPVPHMSNFTDFDPLAAEPSVSLTFLDNPACVALADVLILPGSKQTIDDLEWLRARGFAEALADFGGLTIGICGGLQMLGQSIEDPAGVESQGHARAVAGLGKVAVRTVMRSQKTVRRATGHCTVLDSPFFGYEIHMGETIYGGAEPFAQITREGENAALADGAVSADGTAWGTYVHGLFDCDAFRHTVLRFARRRAGLASADCFSWITSERDSRIDRWANHLRQSLDLDLIRGWLGL